MEIPIPSGAIGPDVVLSPQRKPVEVQFNKPFSLPSNINLDPDNENYVQSLPATQSDWGIVVDVVDFIVEDSEINGGIEIWHLHSSFDMKEVKVRRPAGPTGPYSFAVDVQGLTYYQLKENISGEVIYENEVFSSPVRDEDLDKDTGLWRAYIEDWTEHETGESAEVVFGRQDIASVLFSIRRDESSPVSATEETA